MSRPSLAPLPPNPSQETLFNPVRCFATQGRDLIIPAGRRTDNLLQRTGQWTVQPPEAGTWTPSGPILVANEERLQLRPPWKGLFYLRVTLTVTGVTTIAAWEGRDQTWSEVDNRTLSGGRQSVTFLWFRTADDTSLELRYTSHSLVLPTVISQGALDVMGVRGWL